MHDVSTVNVNLLVALDVLLEERSITRAAQRLGVTQPALSNTLAKLRHLFEDPLLVRRGRGMVLTSLAEGLREPVRRGVGGFRDALRRCQNFDPSTSELSVVVAASDFAQSVLLVPLALDLASCAPGVTVALRHAAHFQDYAPLREGDADCFVGFAEAATTDIFIEPLFQARLVGVARADHPLFDTPLGPADYAACRHVVVTERPGTATGIDRALAERGLIRHVAVTVPHFLQVPALVAGSDLVAAVNERTARFYAPRLGLRWFDLPVPTPVGQMCLAWSARTDTDVAHRWFRQRVLNLALSSRVETVQRSTLEQV